MKLLGLFESPSLVVEKPTVAMIIADDTKPSTKHRDPPLTALCCDHRAHVDATGIQLPQARLQLHHLRIQQTMTIVKPWQCFSSWDPFVKVIGVLQL